MTAPCFENFIGIRGECNPDKPPTSGYYINDLEGITLAKSAKIANQEHVTGVQLLRQKIEMATNMFADEFYSPMFTTGRFRFNLGLCSEQVGVYTNKYHANNLTQRGVKIYNRNTRGFSGVLIKKIAVLTQADATIDVLITDGLNVTTIPIDTIGGIPYEFYPEYYIFNPEATVTSNNASFNDSINHNSGCSCSSFKCGNYFSINGWNGITTASSTYGIQVEMHARCNYWTFLCSIKDRLGLPILYRSGIEVMREVIFTDRANYITLQKDLAIELLKQWQLRYDESLKTLVTQIPLLTRLYHQDECFTCRDSKTAFLPA